MEAKLSNFHQHKLLHWMVYITILLELLTATDLS